MTTNPLTILIVEDEIITATDIQETLEKAGHKITDIAHTYQEAMATINRSVPDLAIVDIMLEHSSGDGVMVARDLANQYQIPVIYLTASSETETFCRAAETLPAAYLLKPFRHNELAFQVELAYLNRQSQNMQSAQTLFLPINKGLEKIEKGNVLYLLAQGSYVKMYMVGDEKPHLLTMNLGYLAQYFSSADFFRLSRSVLINLNHIARIDGNELLMKAHTSRLSIPEASKTPLIKKLTIVRTR